jgi:magnesium-transporting ATPase (P-type)
MFHINHVFGLAQKSFVVSLLCKVFPDGRVPEARDFFVNQTLLTGEPYPVEKHAACLPADGGIDKTMATFLSQDVTFSGGE